MSVFLEYFNLFVIVLLSVKETEMSSTGLSQENGEGSNDSPQDAPSDKSKQELSKKFDSLVTSGYKSVVQCTKAAMAFPSVHENSLLIASPQYIKDVALTSEKVMGLVDSLLASQSIRKSMGKLYLEGQKDILIEANDKLLESINKRIDVMAGIKVATTVDTAPKVVKESWNKNARSSNVWQEVHETKRRKSWFMINASVTDRPQVQFKDKVDNSYAQLFEPKITEKPNALKPLAILVEKYDAVESFCHPYEYELDLFVPGAKFLSCKEPQQPAALADTPLVMVSEPQHVQELVNELKTKDEIAVDLEYHSYRSYQGFTCLMQISTREKDYIVDTLKLRQDLQVLNEVFTDKNVVKVFHGADSDIKWLQKDFGLYIVNMFDTHQACKFLSVPRQSLGYLLKHYCGVDSDKTFQLFDWRHRPLPQPAVDYARSDTHYLLYVYDCMKRDLASAAHSKDNLIVSTFNNSNNICKLKYNKPVFDEEGYVNIFRSHSLLNNQQRYALREMYKWRDRTARETDESTGFLLPNHMLLQMAQSIPRDVQGIFACCNPIPQGVKEHALELHAIILKARLQPLTKAIEKPRVSLNEKKKMVVIPPHDSMDALNYKGLPPVIADKQSIAQFSNSASRQKRKPSTEPRQAAQIALFFEDNKTTASPKWTKVKLKTSRFETPYQRFLMSREYAQALQEKIDKENAEKQKEEDKAVAELPSVVKINAAVVLKNVKSEEKVEEAKEKRKKILKEREEEAGTKRVKVETEDDAQTSSRMKTGKNEERREQPKENVDKPAAATGVKAVDYSKVNYSKKYMANVKVANASKKMGNKKVGKRGKEMRKKCKTLNI